MAPPRISATIPPPVTAASTNTVTFSDPAVEDTPEGFWPERAAIPPQRQAPPAALEHPVPLQASAAPREVTERAVTEPTVPEPMTRAPAATQVIERPKVDEPVATQVITRPEGDEPATSRPSWRTPRRASRGTTEEAAPPEAAPRTKERRTWKPPAISLSWRSVGAVLVALAVAFYIGRGVFGPSANESSQAGKTSGQSVAVPKANKPKTRPVVIDGRAIRAAGALITLNPALAQPGATVTVSGSGFDPRSSVDLVLSSAGDSAGTSLGTAKTDRTGNLNAQVTIPDNVRGGRVIVTAKQRNSDNVATAEAVTAAGMGFAKLNKTTGKPGDTLSVSARGFAPNEKINVYWGRASGRPTSTLQASASGTVSQAPIRVGVGQVGDATLVLVGSKSGTTATVPFFMLGLYPTATAAPYALKAGEQLNVSANGFAPEERLLIYVNTSSGRPAMTAKADTQGNVGGLGFKVPFGLKGSQSLVMVGAESRASVTSGFQVLPYTPSVQTSTYGGSPGTSLSFFAKGFAPNEVVLVYLGRTRWSPGELVSAFRVNDRGEAGAAGSFQITGGDQGTLTFTLVGRQSGGNATASLKVTPANGPVDLPPRQKYTLPPSLRK